MAHKSSLGLYSYNYLSLDFEYFQNDILKANLKYTILSHVYTCDSGLKRSEDFLKNCRLNLPVATAIQREEKQP
jgi:hypothetical protein